MKNIHKREKSEGKVYIEISKNYECLAQFLTIHVQNKRLFKINYDIS